MFIKFSSVDHLALQDWQVQVEAILETMVRILVRLEKCEKREKKNVRRERLADG